MIHQIDFCGSQTPDSGSIYHLPEAGLVTSSGFILFSGFGLCYCCLSYTDCACAKIRIIILVAVNHPHTNPTQNKPALVKSFGELSQGILLVTFSGKGMHLDYLIWCLLVHTFFYCYWVSYLLHSQLEFRLADVGAKVKQT